MRVLFLCSQPPNAAANGGAQRLHPHLPALSSAPEVVLAFVSSDGKVLDDPRVTGFLGPEKFTETLRQVR